MRVYGQGKAKEYTPKEWDLRLTYPQLGPFKFETQQEAAYHLGVHVNTVSNWVNGRTRIRGIGPGVENEK